MTAFYHRLATFRAEYGRAIALAVLLHMLVLLALLQLKPAVTPQLVRAEPVLSYLYQPVVPVSAETNTVAVGPPVATEQATLGVQPADKRSAKIAPEATLKMPSQEVPAPAASPPVPAATAVAQATAAEVDVKRQAGSAASVQQGQSLAQRALQQAGSSSADLAQAGYQHYLQQQQPQKLGVARQHQELSPDPAKQVVTTLDSGLQIVRVKGGCRLADPTKHGFDALMAAREVACGDEVSSAELLKQALQKHQKK